MSFNGFLYLSNLKHVVGFEVWALHLMALQLYLIILFCRHCYLSFTFNVNSIAFLLHLCLFVYLCVMNVFTFLFAYVCFHYAHHKTSPFSLTYKKITLLMLR